MSIKLEEENISCDLQKGIPEDINSIIDNIRDSVDGTLNLGDFEKIIAFLKQDYCSYKLYIPPNICSIFKNEVFLTEVQKYVFNNLKNILKNDSISSFEEISFNLFLLGFGKYNNIIQDLINYDLELLNNLFDEYLSKIEEEIEKGGKNIDLYLGLFINLCELLNKLCILNELDSYRKNNISNITTILKDKINSLFLLFQKNKIELSQDKQDIFKHFIGRIYMNFSHVSYIETENRKLEDICNGFFKIFQNQIKGYKLSTEAKFGNISDPKTILKVFLGNFSYTMMIFLQKISFHPDYNEEELFKNKEFSNILGDFCDNMFIDKDICSNSKSIKNICLNVFCDIYNNENNFDKIDDSDENHKSTVSNFLFSGGRINSDQLESIHHIVMFLESLNLEELLNIGNHLLKNQKKSNFNFEFFKLKIIDVIINKINCQDINEQIEEFFENIEKYIETNKTASQLIHTYMRLYLSMSYFYSFLYEEKYQKKALKNYFIFHKMNGGGFNGDGFNYLKYGKNPNIIAANIGLYQLKRLCNGNGKCNHKCGISIPECIFNIEQTQIFGVAKIEDNNTIENLEMKNKLATELANLLELSFETDKTEDELNKQFSKLLSTSLFHGIAEVSIIDINNTDFKGLFCLSGMDYYEEKIINGYRLFFTYPKMHTQIFAKIYESEKDYIIQNIRNIITSYLKRKADYFDKNTGLPNENKLKQKLEKNKKYTFINMKLIAVDIISRGYGHDHGNEMKYGDEYIRKIAEALLSISEIKGNVYKLRDPSFGILIDSNFTKEQIINLIQKIKTIIIEIKGQTFNLDAVFGIKLDDRENVIGTSSRAVYKAIERGLNYLFYDETFDTHLQDKISIEYLKKLDEAIKKDNIEPFYQAIKKVGGNINKYEALMRVKNSDGKYELPLEYLKVIKQFGKSKEITEIIIQKVFQFAQKNELHFSINLNSEDLVNNDFMYFLKNILSQTEIDPSRITFEILEREWIELEDSISDNIKAIQKLKEMGFQISMDDFGAGSSGINRLNHMLSYSIIDNIKIDGDIVKKLGSDNVFEAESARLDIKYIIDKAEHASRNLGKEITVTVEYIENEKIEQTSISLGADYLQGYHIGKPQKDII